MRRLRARRDDGGFVLVSVILAMFLVTALVAAALAFTLSTQTLARGQQDRNSALAAAQAGVEDYLGRLNRNDDYARARPFTDCANAALRGARAPAPNSCGWTATTPRGWQPVRPGSGASAPAFHYDVDTSGVTVRGSVRVTSTGRSAGRTRTVQALLARASSTQYLYYTDHENADPDNPEAYPGGMPAACSSYWYGASPDGSGTTGRLSTGASCQEINFVGGDVLRGRVHLNDTPLMSASGNRLPSFPDGLQTADPACRAAVPGTPASYGACDRTGTGADYGSSSPVWHKAEYLVDSTASFADQPGCQYTGATRILLNPPASAGTLGTMTVWSRETTGASAACGGAAVTGATGATVPVPDGQVVYVRAGTSSRTCLSGEIDGTLPLGSYRGSASGSSYTVDQGMLTPDQRCGLGNAYVEGSLGGRLTIAAQHSIVVTGDITYAGGLSGIDLLGLVAGNSVAVYHPRMITCQQRRGAPANSSCAAGYSATGGPAEVSGWPHRRTAGRLQLHASIQTLRHSFYVQAYAAGPQLGTLVVRGSLAQKWRGIVGTTNSGYLKDYAYDARLNDASPPYFPSFTGAIWSVRHTGEIADPG